MISKTFVFSKITKATSTIEDTINEWLKDREFKFATQNESAVKGKFVVTVFALEKAGTVRVKAFKDQHVPELDARVNKFLAKNPMKLATQTFVGSNIYTIIFYDTAPKTDDKKETTQPTT